MMRKNTTSSTSVNETSYHHSSSSNSTQATTSSLEPDAPPAGVTSTSPPPPPLDSLLAGNPNGTSGSNQINKPEAGSNNHILLALLTVSILVIAIFAIVTTCCYLKKKKKNMEKKSGEALPTSTGGNKNIQELQPLRYFGDYDQSPVHAMISDPQDKGVTIERFLWKVENDKPTKFSPQQLARITRDFTTKLGSGGFGDVYKGELDGGVLVAVKRLKDNNSAKKIQEQFMAEVGTIGNTYHINLVGLQGFCIEPTMTALVYEYMENGSLDRFLFGGNRTIDWQKLHEIAIGTAKGIAYLHEECQPRIIHYDIKPGNILLDAKLIPKVADFGLAKLCSVEGSHVTLAGFRGTRGYAAPELWKPFCLVTYKCDVYSFGKVLFEIVGRRRNHDTMVSETRQSLSSWTWEMFKKNRLFELVSLCGIEETDREKAERMLVVALLCIQHLPERRPVMSDVVKMLEGGMVVPTPSYPFEPYDPVESAHGSKDCSIARLRKSKTLTL